MTHETSHDTAHDTRHDSGYDVVVIGGGPAGVAGALSAAQAGASVVLIDAGARLGGQYFRHQAGGRPTGHGAERFARQCRALESRATLLLGHKVWAVEQDGDGSITVHCLEGRDERPVSVTARAVLVATGAHDRPLPFPGWDLPGVFTAGGAQALLKGNGVTAGRRVVVSGTGPFLLPVAAGLAAAGASVAGVFEANGLFGLARHPLLAAGKAGEAVGYGAALARRRVPYRTRHAVVAAHGTTSVTHVTVARLDPAWRILSTRTVECDAVAAGYGFVPQIELAVQLGCATGHSPDGSPVVAVDAAQRTTVAGVYAAGEPTGVGGAALSELEGRIAGLTIARDLAAPGGSLDHVPGVLRRRAERLRAFGEALQHAYPVQPGWQDWLADDTLICRCEEVPLAAVREAMTLGATDARSVKLLARPGMGWCQGRVCGYAVSCLSGEPTTQAPRRPIAQPIPLGCLERIDDEQPR
ncbi:NAD(P)/FAD-dependent oxidoreductase [Nonomuraea sp. NPDC003804]|uniref:NAD(P)/FAD-dependent oxidoreductase n=1 Tax=Nonomuraea sp. NPDC003804 TaxID=3154547 RepID=UPI00339F244E